MKYGVFSANTWLYPDTAIEAGQDEISLLTAGNSVGCTQILLHSSREIRYTWQSSGENTLPAPEMNRLIPVYVEKNTGVRGFTVEPGTEADYVCRKAPFWVYDAMVPVEEVIPAPEEGEACGLYLRWPTKGLKAGEYKGNLRLADDEEQIEIQVSLRVAGISVPEQETLRLTNWFSLSSMATYHETQMWTEEHWERIADYGKLMRQVRQTDFMVAPELAECICENGKYVFDFSRTERFIRLYLGLGFNHIEGGTPIFREDWGDASFVVDVCGRHLPAMSEEGYTYLQAYFTGMHDLLKRNGWLHLTIQHVGDEPQAACAVEYRILSGMVRKWMPGVPIIEAVEVPDLDGAVDIWVPKNNSYTLEREAYERKRQFGDTLWYYTCTVPGGWYLNRLLDGDLLRTRYLHWGNKLYDISGYLHWGLNYYGCTDDPFKGRAGKISTLSPSSLPCGDTHIVYPLGKQVLRSVRFEMMRAGCEDYELLRMMEAKDAKKAAWILSRCVRSFTDYTADAAVFEQVYAELLGELANWPIEQ